MTYRFMVAQRLSSACTHTTTIAAKPYPKTACQLQRPLGTGGSRDTHSPRAKGNRDCTSIYGNWSTIGGDAGITCAEPHLPGALTEKRCTRCRLLSLRKVSTAPKGHECVVALSKRHFVVHRELALVLCEVRRDMVPLNGQHSVGISETQQGAEVVSWSKAEVQADQQAFARQARLGGDSDSNCLRQGVWHASELWCAPGPALDDGLSRHRFVHATIPVVASLDDARQDFGVDLVKAR